MRRRPHPAPDASGAGGTRAVTTLVARVTALLAAAALLAGCGAGAGAGEPTWRPQPSFENEPGLPQISPILPPGLSGAAAPGPAAPDPGQPGASPGSTEVTDPAVVATKLAAPTGIAVLPDGSALVGERSTGRIVRVQPAPGQPTPTVRTLTGVDGTGGGGLLDLALSPHYLQDNLIFAYITTATDNRVVVFTLTGPVTPVITGIPRGATGNTARLAFGADGQLYVGTGNADSAALAADPASLAGKVLRISDIGEPAAGNPTPGSPVYASGFDDIAGLCLDARGGQLLQVQAAPVEINAVQPGQSYAARGHGPVATLPSGSGSPGGCTVLDGVLYVTALDGQALLAARLGGKPGAVSVGSFETALPDRYGRLRTVVAAPDGALWLTTSNRDGHGKPVADDERVLRIVPSGSAATAPV